MRRAQKPPAQAKEPHTGRKHIAGSAIDKFFGEAGRSPASPVSCRSWLCAANAPHSSSAPISREEPTTSRAIIDANLRSMRSPLIQLAASGRFNSEHITESRPIEANNRAAASHPIAACRMPSVVVPGKSSFRATARPVVVAKTAAIRRWPVRHNCTSMTFSKPPGTAAPFGNDR